MRLILLFCALIFSIFGFSQEYTSTRDSIKDAEVLRYFKYRTKLQFRIGHERTLLKTGVNIKLNTFRLGVQFKYRYKLGVITFISKRYNTVSEVPEVSYYKTALVGIGFYGEYVFIDTYRFYLGAPISFSSARISSLAQDNSDNSIKEYNWKSDRFNVFSMGVTGGYNVNYWLTFSAGLGYRITYSTLESENNMFSTPFYSIGFKWRFGQFVETIFHHKKVVRMKQAYFRNKKTWRANTFRKRHRELYHD